MRTTRNGQVTDLENTELNLNPATEGTLEPPSSGQPRPMGGGAAMPSLCGTGTCSLCPGRCGSSTAVLRIAVPADARDELSSALGDIANRHRFMVDRDAAEMMALAGGLFRRVLPEETLRRLAHFGAGYGRPILVVEGLPVPRTIPATPYRGFGDDTLVVIPDLMLFGLYETMSVRPVAFAYENHGRLMRNVVPNPDAAGQKSSHGFDVELAQHTDNPCGPFEHGRLVGHGPAGAPIPRFLGFTGLRNLDAAGRPVPTRIVPVAPALRELGAETLAALGCGDFAIHPPASNFGLEPRVGVPLVLPCHGEWYLRYNADPTQIVPLTGNAACALERLGQTLRQAGESAVEVEVAPGRILVFDNYRVTHTRSAFDPGPNLAAARWMRRCYACRSLANGPLADPVHWPNLWA